MIGAVGLLVGLLRVAAPVPVVAVLYFDNNTGVAAYDPLRKGLADMMVTDLSQVSGLRVVERDRLQDLVEELKLQESSFFDPATAQKVGRGLGATHVVTGAFAEVAPRFRVDARLVEIATGAVVLAEKVTGARDQVFELQQQLVGRLASSLNARAAAAEQSRTRVPDSNAVLDYGRALDALDKGELERADGALDKLSARAPQFLLGRERREQVRRMLEELSRKRDSAAVEALAQLDANAQRVLASLDVEKVTAEQARAALAYRYVRGMRALQLLRSTLGTGGVCNLVTPGREQDATTHWRAYVANWKELRRELDTYARRHVQQLPNGVTWLDTSFRLPPEDAARAQTAALPEMPAPPFANHEALRFILMGQWWNGSDAWRMTLCPPPAEQDDDIKGEALRQLAELVARPPADPARPHEAVTARQLQAEVLFFHGRDEDAQAVLADTLERFPRAPQYASIERQLKVRAGLEHDHGMASRKDWAEGVRTCDEMKVAKGISTVMQERTWHHGAAAWTHITGEVDRACPDKPRVRARAWLSVALAAAQHGHCGVFNSALETWVTLGGSASDAAGYRRNMGRSCTNATP